jgi:hypothetical protein
MSHRQRPGPGAAFALALALCFSWGQARAAVALSPAQQRRLGIEAAVLAGQHRTAQVDAFAKVLDTGPLAALESDLETAISAAEASSAEAERARALARADNGVSKKDMEAAVAQAKADAAKLALLRQRLGLEWGPGVAGLSDARRRSLIHALSQGKAALVEIDSPSNEGQEGARSVDIDIGSGSVGAVVIGHSRNAEPRLQSSGLLALVSGPSAILFSNGLTQSAHINAPVATAGVVVPRSALLRDQGTDWVYVRSGDSFARRQVQGAVPQADGYFVAQGLRPGEAVVVRGVAALFAAERAQSRPGA